MMNLFANFKSTKVIEESISKSRTISKITKSRRVKILSIENNEMTYSLDGKSIVWYYNNYHSSNTMIINYRNEVFNYYERIIGEIERVDIDNINISTVTCDYVTYEFLGKRKFITARSIDIYLSNPKRWTDYKESYERLLDDTRRKQNGKH